jgi:hypothetical protein
MTHDTTAHIHDPDPPRRLTGCIFGKEKWQPEEWIRVKKLIDRKHDLAYIALVSGRSKEQIKGKLRWETMSKEKKAERRERINKLRTASGEYKSTPRPDKPAALAVRAPAEVMEDRARRMAAPKTITGMLCGDPPPGWSALDRKRQGVTEQYLDKREQQLQRRPSLPQVPA